MLAYHSPANAGIKRLGDQMDIGDPNELLAKNLTALLGGRSAEIFCKERKPHYISGSKKGKKVSPRTIRSAASGEYSAGLDLVAAIAHSASLEVYQLLFPDFDPAHPPLMISRQQDAYIKNLQRAAIPLNRKQEAYSRRKRRNKE